ncbi:MAG TPA: GNAT family N-acetyltransferase [Casimicrobiaceae bacterium]|nr:GNAT family N-acetyltransferase [Casimicrobiaceae bacterium]
MYTSVAWRWRRFAELSPSELYALLAARSEVFVVEQRCQFLDADGHDLHAWHLLGWSGEPAVLAAYLRLLEPGRKYAEPSIGRVLTTASFRGRGLGREAMHQGLRQAVAQYPGCPVRVAAQLRLERFYASLGFSVISLPYQEDGIAHVDMLRPPIDLAGADH